MTEIQAGLKKTIPEWWVPPRWQQGDAFASVRSYFREKRPREQLVEGCSPCQTMMKKEEEEAKAGSSGTQ